MSKPKKSTKTQKAGETKVTEERTSPRGNRLKKAVPRYEQIIFRSWCKACGICSAFCPRKVIERDETGSPTVVRADDCIGCRFCELHCPDFAITVRERNGDEVSS